MTTFFVNYYYRVGVIFFLVMNQIFGNMSAVDLFVRQKSLFMLVKTTKYPLLSLYNYTIYSQYCSHENSSGYYRVSIYFIAKVTCDLISTRLFPLCFFAVISYFMLGNYNCIYTHLFDYYLCVFRFSNSR